MEFDKYRFLDFTFRVFDLFGLGWDLRICVCSKFLGGVDGGWVECILSNIVLGGVKF